jgi:hypothetical protein
MKRQKHDVWMVIFMDDVDAPDLAIHSDGAIIRKFDELSLEL